jgi:hypothetical protein
MSNEHWDGTHPEDVIGEDSGEETAEWNVLVEETISGMQDTRFWNLTRVIPVADRNEARHQAFDLAKNYKPMHPMSPRGRRIFQIGFDTWLVQVNGAVSDFSFRVSAGQQV